MYKHMYFTGIKWSGKDFKAILQFFFMLYLKMNIKSSY